MSVQYALLFFILTIFVSVSTEVALSIIISHQNVVRNYNNQFFFTTIFSYDSIQLGDEPLALKVIVNFKY